LRELLVVQSARRHLGRAARHPAAAVITDRFEATARAMAGASGLADYPFAIIPHPIAGNSDEALREKAAAVYEAVVRLLTSRSSG
jgi:hypothetical protein